MGIVTSCCGKSAETSELITPTMEIKRQQQREAAERRARESETRGIKNIERVQQQKVHSEEVARRIAKSEKMSSEGAPVLRWQTS